jgi:hypothetical protein
VEEIDVKMKNVELLRALAHLIDHQHEVRNGRGSRLPGNGLSLNPDLHPRS